MRILRPQEIPVYVAEGLFDLGITGRDWVEETGSDVVSLGELRYSKASANPVRVVVAVADDSPAQQVADLHHGVRVSSEYPELTRRFFADRGIDADVRLSYGASEAKVPDIADCVVDITETGRALRAAGLRVIDTILTSYTEVVANPAAHADPAKRHAMGQLMTLLNGALEARTKVLLKLNVAAEHFEAVLGVLPSAKSPTVSELAGGGFAVESVVEKRAHQPRHPRAQGRRRDGSARDPDRQDRPLMPTRHGHRLRRARRARPCRDDDGTSYLFHCVEIADGTRTIEVGAG